MRRLFWENGRPLPCEAAGDANGDDRVDIADPLRLLGHLFSDLGPLPEPSVACGETPSTPLTCLTYDRCP